MRLAHWGNRMVMQLSSKFGSDCKQWNKDVIDNSLLMCEDYMTRKNIILESTLLTNWDSFNHSGGIEDFHRKLTAVKKNFKKSSSSSSVGSNYPFGTDDDE